MQGQIKNYQDNDYFFVNMVDEYKQMDIFLENHSMKLYPLLEIYDSRQRLVTAPMLGMTEGQNIHHAFNAAPNEKYYVHVGANAGGRHSNYELHFEVK